MPTLLQMTNPGVGFDFMPAFDFRPTLDPIGLGLCARPGQALCVGLRVKGGVYG